MEIKEFRYNNISEADRSLLINLISCVWKNEGGREIHLEEMNAMSFCALENNRFIGYAGVIEWNINVQDEIFRMCGLSCVCTHPLYRKRGLATNLVRRATDWIKQSNVLDIGLFTCSHEHVSLYKQVGFWEIAPNLIIKESDREGAYQSDIQDLDVFKLIISRKAKICADYFENTTINLNFPSGQFI